MAGGEEEVGGVDDEGREVINTHQSYTIDGLRDTIRLSERGIFILEQCK